eukprot:12916219-Alexandrium_andersonii.AAC.1
MKKARSQGQILRDPGRQPPKGAGRLAEVGVQPSSPGRWLRGGGAQRQVGGADGAAASAWQ